MANAVEIVIKALDSTKGGIQSAVKNLDGLASASKAAVGAAAALTTAWGLAAAALINKSIEAAAEMEHLSKSTGVTVEDFSRIASIAKRADVDLTTLSTTFKFLNKSISEASQNSSGDIAKMFNVLGVSVTDASGSARGAAQVFADLSVKFNQFKDGPEKIAASLALMGKAGNDILPVFEEAGEKLENLANLPAAFTTEQADAADRFQKNMMAMNKAIGRFSNALAAQLLPYLEQASGAFEKFFSNQAANQDIVDAAVTSFKFMASGLLLIYSGAKAVATVLATSLYANLINVKTAFTAVWDTLAATSKGLLASAKAVYNLANAYGGLARVAMLLAKGEFSNAFEAYKQTADEVSDQILQVADTVASAFSDTWKAGSGAVKDGWNQTEAVLSGGMEDIVKDANAAREKWDAIWSVNGKTTLNIERKATSKDPTAAFPRINKSGAITDEYDQKHAQSLIKAMELERQMQESQLKGAASISAKYDESYRSRVEQISQLTLTEEEQWGLIEKANQEHEAKLTEAHSQGEFAREEIDRAYQLGDVSRLQELLTSEDAINLARLENNRELAALYVQDWREASESIKVQLKKVDNASFDGAVRGLSTSLKGLVDGTMKWGEAWKNLANTILTSVLDAITQMIAKLLVIQGLKAVLGGGLFTRLFGFQQGGLVPNSKGFAEGGYTGAGLTNRVAGVVHAGEYVIPANVVNSFGVPLFDSIRNGILPYMGGQQQQQDSGPSIIEVHLDGEVLGRGIGRLSRDGRMVLSASAIA